MGTRIFAARLTFDLGNPERARAEQDAVSCHDPLHGQTASALSEGGTSTLNGAAPGRKTCTKDCEMRTCIIGGRNGRGRGLVIHAHGVDLDSGRDRRCHQLLAAITIA
jgi:hypothetical protein